MARVLIVTDIHGNRDALDAVVADAGAADRIWCLGDIVGYGPEPAACLAWVREHCEIVLSGNHDYAVFDPAVAAGFQPECRRCRRVDARATLPGGRWSISARCRRMVEGEGVTLAHGSPVDPIWTYILSVIDAHEAFAAFAGPCCFVGHTHVAACYVAGSRIDGRASRSTTTCRSRWTRPGTSSTPAASASRATATPAPRISGMIPDAATVVWKRVRYDIARDASEDSRGGTARTAGGPARPRSVSWYGLLLPERGHILCRGSRVSRT